MGSYTVLRREGRFEETIQRSRFIGRAVPVETEEQVKAFLAQEKKAYPDARHCCWAYVLGPSGDQKRYSDDGEPQGTAGLPMLDVLCKKNITDTLVCVTRYFGGILLGTGGLTRAYGSCALGAVEDGGLQTMLPTVRFRIAVTYPIYARLQKVLDNDPSVLTEPPVFDADVRFFIAVREEDEQRIVTLLRELSAGEVLFTERESSFYPWQIG